MGALAEIKGSITVIDGTQERLSLPIHVTWTVDKIGQVTYTIGAGMFVELAPPTGAQFAYLDPGDAVALTLKGVIGDQGIALTPATLPINCPVLMPLGDPTSIGILNGGAGPATVKVTYL